MARQKHSGQALLQWSAAVSSSDVQDPLGLGLRGSTRMANQLLFCITTLTRRARYFSFIPWAVFDSQKREKTGTLRERVLRREQALTLGCVAHHDGKPCGGGSLVGSDGATAWFAKGRDTINLRKNDRFAKVAAYDQYFRPLVDLGAFVAHDNDDRPEESEEEPAEAAAEVQLSPLGMQIASRLDSLLSGLSSTADIAAKDGVCTVKALASFGKRAGLCEIMAGSAPDRDLLRDLLFTKLPMKGESHRLRRQSLLLTVDLCRQFSPSNWLLADGNFGQAVYYGYLADGKSKLRIWIPTELTDIATRWRMFYFHHFMSVALEGLFAWLVTHVGDFGLAGTTMDTMVAELDGSSTQKALGEILGTQLPCSFRELTPVALFAAAGLASGPLDRESSVAIDTAVPVTSPLCEDALEKLLRSKEHLRAATGVALPLVLLIVTLARYRQWIDTRYDRWLWAEANDPRLDLVPPLVLEGLEKRFHGQWWTTPFGDLARHILDRYIVRQHTEVSFGKTATGMGEKCLLSVHGDCISSTKAYTGIGMGNPRLRSAVRILADLGLLEEDDDVHRLTDAGKDFLKAELAAEPADGVS
jgi:hypothetical protein